MIIEMQSFGLTPHEEQDATIPVFEALQACKDADSPVLLFPRGRYHFHPEKAVERQVYITNHDQGGTRKTAFHLAGLRNLIVDGQGSEFFFHGSIIPFLLDDAHRIELKHFTIDWERPMFDQGTVVSVEEDAFVMRLRQGVPYTAVDGRLLFEYDGQLTPVWGLHDIDPATMAHAFQSGDRISWSSFKKLRLDEAGPGLIRVSGSLRHMPKVGSVISMRFGRRENPGFFLKNCSQIRIEDVTVHHAPGMGLVAQRCTDIHLRRFDVKLRPGSGRVVTATADATHFTNCRGDIVIEHCLFENQLDDPCNVHGIYAGVTERLSDRAIIVRLMEAMTKGVEMAVPGDEVHFVRSDSLLTYAAAAVESAHVLNADYQLIRLKDPLPDDVRPGVAMENATWNANLTVRHCTVRANRARGFLITTPGNVLLEHNTISAPGAAIKISGDLRSWYESGAVKDVTIRDNRFLACTYCPDWGRAVIHIDPEIECPEAADGFYHRNIRIERNVFEMFDIGLVYGHSVDGFTFKGNRVVPTDAYPRHGLMKHAIELRKVRGIDISGNDAPEQFHSVLIDNKEADFV